MPNDCLSEAGHLYGPVGARAGPGSEGFNSKWPFGASEASVGAYPAATEGPRLWTEGGYVAQGRLDKTPMNTPTDPGHHQGS